MFVRVGRIEQQPGIRLFQVSLFEVLIFNIVFN